MVDWMTDGGGGDACGGGGHGGDESVEGKDVATGFLL